MINMGDDRHITDVMLVIHNTSKLLCRELHLHTPKYFFPLQLREIYIHITQPNNQLKIKFSYAALTILTSLKCYRGAPRLKVKPAHQIIEANH